MERSGDLVRVLLAWRTQDGGGPRLTGGSLVGEGLDESRPFGFVSPERVREISAALSRVDPDEAIRRHRDALITYAERLGLFIFADDELDQVAAGARDVAGLFHQAADAAETVVVHVVA